MARIKKSLKEVVYLPAGFTEKEVLQGYRRVEIPAHPGNPEADSFNKIRHPGVNKDSTQDKVQNPGKEKNSNRIASY